MQLSFNLAVLLRNQIQTLEVQIMGPLIFFVEALILALMQGGNIGVGLGIHSGIDTGHNRNADVRAGIGNTLEVPA